MSVASLRTGFSKERIVYLIKDSARGSAFVVGYFHLSVVVFPFCLSHVCDQQAADTTTGWMDLLLDNKTSLSLKNIIFSFLLEFKPPPIQVKT
jgi:hypothetical protein